MSPRPDRRQQINHERKDITRENKRNDPFQNSADILLMSSFRIHAHAESDCETDFDDDEG
jgi:hypothetical protein